MRQSIVWYQYVTKICRYLQGDGGRKNATIAKEMAKDISKFIYFIDKDNASNDKKTSVSIEEKLMDGATLNQQTLTIRSIGRQMYGSTLSMGAHSLQSSELTGFCE